MSETNSIHKGRTMSEMVERVETAVLQKIEELFGAIHCNANGAIGRAAIEAMREPTEAMAALGRDMAYSRDAIIGRHETAMIYWAMTNEALKDGD